MKVDLKINQKEDEQGEEKSMRNATIRRFRAIYRAHARARTHANTPLNVITKQRNNNSAFCGTLSWRKRRA